jgi:hypothetical protein
MSDAYGIRSGEACRSRRGIVLVVFLSATPWHRQTIVAHPHLTFAHRN